MAMQRIDRLREILTRKKLDSLLITSTINRNYISGFTGSTATILLTQKTALFVTDSRYTVQAKQELGRGFEIKVIKSSKEYYQAFRDVVKKDGVKTLGIEAKNLTVSQYE